MLIVGYVVKALAPGERAKESRMYATGHVAGQMASWSSFRGEAHVMKGIDLAPNAGKTMAERLRDALIARDCVPRGRRLAVVRITRVKRKRGG